MDNIAVNNRLKQDVLNGKGCDKNVSWFWPTLGIVKRMGENGKLT